MSNYKDLSAIELRKMLLNNTLDVALMDLDEYEKLFGYEIELDEPNDVVLDFCNKGLNQDKYYDTDVQKPPYKSILRKHNARKNRNKHIVYRIARQATMIILIFGIVGALAQGVSMALGYNLIEMIWNAIKSPNNIAVHSDGDKRVIWNDGTRTYYSMSELREGEKLNILYPMKLPLGYEFTKIVVEYFGTGLEIRAFATEPFVEFIIYIGVNQPVEILHKSNGIEYGVFEFNGRYQAEWNYKDDYYRIIVDNETTLSEIINNLTEV